MPMFYINIPKILKRLAALRTCDILRTLNSLVSCCVIRSLSHSLIQLMTSKLAFSFKFPFDGNDSGFGVKNQG